MNNNRSHSSADTDEPLKEVPLMSGPDHSPGDTTSHGPAHPQVHVQLSGTDGNAHVVIGRVAATLRREAGNTAADDFTTAAYDCGSYDALLQLVMRTVHVQ